MLGMRIDKSLFFDRQKVIDAVGKAEAKVMARGGGLVRTIARRSMKKRKGSAEHGTPPSVHKGTIRNGRYGVLFAYEPEKHSTVIGPSQIGGSDALDALEHGGRFRRRVRKYPPGKGRAASPRQLAALQRLRKQKKSTRAERLGRAVRVQPQRVTETVSYPSGERAYAFMGPALEKARPKLADPWADSITA